MAQNRYLAPGITTESIPGPIIRGLSVAGSALGLVGRTVGYQTANESLVVPDEGPSSPLLNLGVAKASVVVSNPGTGELYEETTDYTLTKLESGETYTLTRVDLGGIESGEVVRVEYHYTGPTYFNRKTFMDTDEVFEAYGQPFNEDGELVSELSYAAQIAFVNGASHVVCAAVQTTGASVIPSEYMSALNKIDGDASIGVVSVANGSASLLPFVRQHVVNASNSGLERRAVFGFDGVSESGIDSEARVTAANETASERVMLVGPSKVTITNPRTGRDDVLGSQYLAVSVAALATTLPPQTPLTRKQVAGFRDLPEDMSSSERNNELANGVAVVERSIYGPMRIVHGVTTNVSSLDKREWSVVGQQDELARVLRETFDNDGLLGGVINDTTLINVKASADTALQSLMSTGAVLGYQSLKVRQMSENLDTIEVRFEWRPSMPLNYIQIKFSMDLTTGDTEFTTL